MNKILQIIDLKKNFGAITASNNINFCLETGEIHALIGPNGAGKSTLIKQIMGEMKQDSGEIILSGINISNLTTEDRIHLGFARSFQITDVISDFTIFQNVLLAKIGKEKKFYNFYSSIDSGELTYEEIKTILLKIDLWDEREKPASLLSHGERRQLEIGIALALNPKLILLDEPMAGLSLDKIEKMKVIFNQIKDDVPILLIEHNMDVVFSIADRISVLVNGKIIASGTSSEIKSNSDVKEAYLGTA
jgi:branched-chain amino acid transport system ATP-binding protein|tara:strand:+ start:914 stop:1657 length:744 start_codon:yes stop_codon:yes gene_type:complete